MPQELKTQVVENVLRAEVSGAFSLSNAKIFFRQILELACEQDLCKILIDARHVTGDISTMARFDFGTFMSELRPAGIRIAFVGSTEIVWPDRFLENVSVTRGVNAKVTTDVAEALDWLDMNPAA